VKVICSERHRELAGVIQSLKNRFQLVGELVEEAWIVMKRVDFLIRSLSRPNLRHTQELDRFADDQEVCGELEITLADCDAMRCAVL
jgi:hypothetical protein